MKKLLTGLTAISFLSMTFNSCKQEEVDRSWEIFWTDAIASGEAMAGMAETPFAYFFPEAAAGVATAAGVSASAAIMSITPNPRLPISVSLPANLMVKENPFEKVGVMHNVALDYVAKNIAKSEYHKLMDAQYRDIIIEKAVGALSISANEKETLVGNAKTLANKDPDKYHESLQHYFTTDREAILGNIPSNTSLQVQLKDFAGNFSGRFNSTRGTNVVNNVGIINQEIMAVIKSNESTELKNVKLVFLSVYKHSYYFWSNH